MWWVLGISIWLILGLCVCYLQKIEWNIKYPDSGWDWDCITGLYVACMLVPPIALAAIVISEVNHVPEMFKIFFNNIGGWFKDHIDWKW